MFKVAMIVLAGLWVGSIAGAYYGFNRGYDLGSRHGVEIAIIEMERQAECIGATGSRC